MFLQTELLTPHQQWHRRPPRVEVWHNSETKNQIRDIRLKQFEMWRMVADWIMWD